MIGVGKKGFFAKEGNTSMKKKMFKAVLLFVVAAVSVSVFPGCTSTYNHLRNEVKMYNKVIRRDFLNMNRTFDRHFMRYDWDDPTL